MIDEETDQELKVISSSFCDPYLLLIRDDHSSMLLKLDRKGELDEVEGGETFKSLEWRSGCLHWQVGAQQPLVYMLSSKGTLNVGSCSKDMSSKCPNALLDLSIARLKQTYLRY